MKASAAVRANFFSRRLLCQRFVSRAFLGPNAAPVVPTVDPLHYFAQIVWINSSGLVARQIMRKYQLHTRVAWHERFLLGSMRKGTLELAL